MNKIRWINNGNINKRIRSEEPLPNGFCYGKLEFKKNINRNHSTGLKWFNDGVKNIRLRTDVAPDGYEPGRIQNWFTNGEIDIRSTDVVPPPGFRKGRSNLDVSGENNPSWKKLNEKQKDVLTNLQSYYEKFYIKENVPLSEISKIFGLSQSVVATRASRLNLPTYNNRTSYGERQIGDFVESQGVEVLRIKKVIKPFEIDIFIPKHNLGIEYNGLYYHSEIAGKKDKNYHLSKTLTCEKAGIQLLQFTDEQWVTKNDIVKNIIHSKLGLNKKLHARKLIIKYVPKDEARDFLEKYHLQGSTNSSVQIGLYDTNDLVSIATFGPSRFKDHQWELLRFCCVENTTVVGGLSKLITFFRKENTEKLISYCDRMYSNGASYLKAGFTLSHVSAPGYRYTNDYITTHNRIQFQKHKLTNMNGYDIKKTEWEIMLENGYDRYWDCGQLVFKHE